MPRRRCIIQFLHPPVLIHGDSKQTLFFFCMIWAACIFCRSARHQLELQTQKASASAMTKRFLYGKSCRSSGLRKNKNVLAVLSFMRVSQASSPPCRALPQLVKVENFCMSMTLLSVSRLDVFALFLFGGATVNYRDEIFTRRICNF